MSPDVVVLRHAAWLLGVMKIESIRDVFRKCVWVRRSGSYGSENVGLLYSNCGGERHIDDPKTSGLFVPDFAIAYALGIWYVVLVQRNLIFSSRSIISVRMDHEEVLGESIPGYHTPIRCTHSSQCRLG